MIAQSKIENLKLVDSAQCFGESGPGDQVNFGFWIVEFGLTDSTT